MKPMAVPRRFVLDRSNGRYALQFGYGSDSELNTSSVAEPSNMTLKMHARDFISDTSFDPSKILQTDKFGVGPSNTALTVVYKINSTSNTNAKHNMILPKAANCNCYICTCCGRSCINCCCCYNYQRIYNCNGN